MERKEIREKPMVELLDPLEELNEVLTDNDASLLELAKAKALLEEREKELERLKREMESLKNQTVVRRTRSADPLENLENLPLRVKYGVLLSVLQRLPYILPTQEQIDIDALCEKPIDKDYIILIARIVDSLSLRKRVSKKDNVNYFEDYLEELGVTNTSIDDCPL